MEEKSTNNQKNALENQYQTTQTQNGMFSQIEEIIIEYQKNKQLFIEELVEGLNAANSDLSKLFEDISRASMREEKRRENLAILRSSCCKITKEFYDTIKFHFNMPLFKKP